MQTTTREQAIINHLKGLRRDADMRDGIRAMNDLTIDLLAGIACDGTTTFDEARIKADSYIAAARAIARNIGTLGRNASLSTVLTVITTEPEHRDVVESLTVDGEVVTDLIAALYSPN